MAVVLSLPTSTTCVGPLLTMCTAPLCSAFLVWPYVRVSAHQYRDGVCGSRAPCTLAGLATQTGYVDGADASFPTEDGIATP